AEPDWPGVVALAAEHCDLWADCGADCVCSVAGMDADLYPREGIWLGLVCGEHHGDDTDARCVFLLDAPGDASSVVVSLDAPDASSVDRANAVGSVRIQSGGGGRSGGDCTGNSLYDSGASDRVCAIYGVADFV